MGVTDISSRNELVMSPDAIGYIYLNVCPTIPPADSACEYIYLNVGMNNPPSPDSTEYIYLDVLARERFVGWGNPL